MLPLYETQEPEPLNDVIHHRWTVDLEADETQESIIAFDVVIRNDGTMDILHSTCNSISWR